MAEGKYETNLSKRSERSVWWDLSSLPVNSWLANSWKSFSSLTSLWLTQLAIDVCRNDTAAIGSLDFSKYLQYKPHSVKALTWLMIFTLLYEFLWSKPSPSQYFAVSQAPVAKSPQVSVCRSCFLCLLDYHRTWSELHFPRCRPTDGRTFGHNLNIQ